MLEDSDRANEKECFDFKADFKSFSSNFPIYYLFIFIYFRNPQDLHKSLLAFTTSYSLISEWAEIQRQITLE